MPKQNIKPQIKVKCDEKYLAMQIKPNRKTYHWMNGEPKFFR